MLRRLRALFATAFTLRPGRALRLVWRGAPGWTLASMPLVAAQGLLPLAALYLVKKMVDAVAAGLATAEPAAAFREVGLWIALAAGVALLSAVVDLGANWVFEAQAHAVTDHVYERLHQRSVAVDLAFYEDARYHDTLHRAQQDAPHRPAQVVQRFTQLGRSMLGLTGMAGLLVSFHWGIVLVLVLTALPSVAVRVRFASQQYGWSRSRTASERKAWYLHWLLTRDSHAKEVRLFGLGALLRERFSDLRRTLRHEAVALAGRRSAAESAARAVAIAGTFGCFAFVAHRALTGAVTLGDLVMVFQAFQRGQAFLRELLGGFAGLYEDNLFLGNLFEFLDLEPRVVTPPAPARPASPAPRLTRGIAVEGLSFRYPNGQREVLRGVELAVGAGEVVALVGANSAGKTTLIKLLCRLYDPSAGRITWDGVDLRAFDPAALRRAISVVFQDYARYHLTARENIGLGDVEQPMADGRVEAMARRANVHDALAALPRGYDTVLGKWFEGGEELSIGQWQKLALARAFLRDAALVILDEPTSALDAASEEAVMRDFLRLIEGRSAILISHRLSTVRLADTIYVLDDGAVVEHGSHDALLAAGGRYARMFETQARRYR